MKRTAFIPHGIRFDNSSVFIFVIFLLFSLSANAFGGELDTNYIKVNKKKWIIKSWTDYRVISLSMSPLDFGSMLKNSILYIPNVSFSQGIAASWKFITLSYSFKIPYTTRNADKYGSSDYRDVKFTFTKQKFVISSTFRQYKGFYTENSSSLYTSWLEKNPRPQRPDISYLYLGMEGFWIFNNKKFSSDAYFIQRDVQYKSAFSMLMMCDFGITQMKGDTFLIPFETGYQGKLSDMTKLGFYSMDASFGVVYSGVIKHRVYISPILFTGFGIQLKQYQKASDDLTEVRLIYRSNFRLSMGYNSKSFFGGIFIETENVLMPEKKLLMLTNALGINGFFGVKF